MAKSPTHYKLTVNRPIEFARARFRPGATYTVKAQVHADLKKDHPEAIATAEPFNKE